MTTNDQPRRLRQTGNNIVVVVGAHTTRIEKVQREYRFAYELINVSRYHAREAKRASSKNFWRVRSNTISAVYSSYAALEAAYNEFVHMTALSRDSPLSGEKREVIHYLATENLTPEPRQNTLQRFNMLLRILERTELPSNGEPYQSANLVRLLRNMLVHPLPGEVVTFDIDDPDLSSQQEIARKLRSCLKLDKRATFPDAVLIPACAVWANRSAERFLREFEKLSGINLGFVLRSD